MEDITQWMASNCVNLNPATTDFMWCTTHHSVIRVHNITYMDQAVDLG